MTKLKGERKRAYRPKTRSGCLTCKIRRIKCDEARPDCLRCTSTGRSCDGYVSTSAPITIGVPSTPSLKIQASPRSRRSLAFFTHRTRPQLAGFFGSEFWERLVLQAAFHEPAVRHAVFAIGSCHERAMYHKEKGEVEWFAVQEYNHAIRHLIHPSTGMGKGNASVDVYLIMSILFACLENIQGNHASAIAHLQSGVKLLRETVYDRRTGILDCRQFVNPNRGNSYASFETYAKIFASLDSQASRIIGDYYNIFIASSPPSYAEAVFGDLPLSFTSIEQAKATWEYGACLFSGTLDTKLSADATQQLPHKPDSAPSQRGHLVKLTEKFFHALEDLAQERKFSLREELAENILMLNVLVTWASFEMEKTGWGDIAVKRWEDMVSLGEKVVSMIIASEDNSTSHEASSFCLESGYILPMYAVASNCPDIRIRRRAIAVLRVVSRQEGLWNSYLAADTAERVIEIEERVARDARDRVGSCDEFELFSSRPVLEIDANGGRLRYIPGLGSGVAPSEVVEEAFSW
ncbi:hypothetical protein F5Y17DRAFT_336956 [Xylariaceae sp. FL0594]|nr:hypothetical protein F5Y17DRAFT_336956 [Xylariaceae sp. FL0594]